MIDVPCDCRCCRLWADATRREVDAWRAAANQEALAPIVQPDDLRARLSKHVEVMADTLAERDKLRGELNATRSVLEAAELRCMRLDRELSHVSEEFRDTAMVAESIVATPAAFDAKLEAALVDAIGIIDNLSRRCGGAPLSTTERARVAELKGLVPS